MKLAIFDFDGTLFPQDTLPFLAKQWKRMRYSKAKLLSVLFPIGFVFLKYKLGAGRKKREEAVLEVMQKFTKLFGGMKEQEVNGFFDRCAEIIACQLNRKVLEELKSAKKSGFHIVLLSGCYEYLLGLIGDWLSADTVMGTKLNFRHGKVDVSRPLNVTYGPEKLKLLNKHYAGSSVQWDKSCAYADSFSDLSVLEAVGIPVAVSPDAELLKIAEEKNWRIISG